MYKYIKRIIDILFSLIIIIITIPLQIIVYLILKIDLGGKIIFKQQRYGYKMKPFTIYKFKSMKDDQTLSHAERVTKICKIIRQSGLDELPNAYNILIGDMSFVGPRPLMVNDDTMPKEFLNPKRYETKPGIFGLAQINGRRYITNSNKIKYDIEYNKKISFCLDIKLFFGGIWQVITQFIEFIQNKK